MNARDQEKAAEATERRREDVSDAVIEGIGELLFRRTRRASKPEDKLIDIHIHPRDVPFIYNWCATSLDVALPATTLDLTKIETVADLAAAIVAMLPDEAAS